MKIDEYESHKYSSHPNGHNGYICFGGNSKVWFY